jgi:hypothetical protein
MEFPVLIPYFRPDVDFRRDSVLEVHLSLHGSPWSKVQPNQSFIQHQKATCLRIATEATIALDLFAEVFQSSLSDFNRRQLPQVRIEVPAGRGDNEFGDNARHNENRQGCSQEQSRRLHRLPDF